MRPADAAAIILSVLFGAVIFLIASTVFAYHSNNHDEAVYLLQAAMLLEGQFVLEAGELAGTFRPWFFVVDGGTLYPKYTPVPSAIYAIGMALGEPRISLALIASGTFMLVYRLGTAVVDRTVGLVASLLYGIAPMALITTATFLPYAATTLLNLLFAILYLHSVHSGSRRAAVGAGLAIGLSFFGRPFTALLFALPFIAHAGYATLTSLQRGATDRLLTHGTTGVVGLLLVGVTLGYNRLLTGSALVFPYQAFAPMDGPGFGHREILGHSIEYTPELALEANTWALQFLATRWVPLGLLGTALALVGVGTVALRFDEARPGDRLGATLLAGLFVTVPVGNLLFWGNVNVLGTIDDPTDGMVSLFGPFYHFDLLVPVALFAAYGAVTVGDWVGPRLVRRLRSVDRRTVGPALVLGCAATVVLAGTVTGALLMPSLERNAAYAEKYEEAYAPIESAEFEHALVFVPTPYGDWQQHPFQYLRNDPGFDGPVVYALDRGPAEQFQVIDHYPDRSLYRYTYRGEWTPRSDDHIEPSLQPLSLERGQAIDGRMTVGVPDHVESAIVRVAEDGIAETTYRQEPGSSVTVNWTLAPDALFVGNQSVPIGGVDSPSVSVTLVQPDGSTFTYRQDLVLRSNGSAVELIWPPERTVCPLVHDCGRTGTHLPADPVQPWVTFDVARR